MKKYIPTLAISLNWIILILIEGNLYEKYHMIYSIILLSVFIIPIVVKYILTSFTDDKKNHLNRIYFFSGGIMLLFGLSAYIYPPFYELINHFEATFKPICDIKLLSISLIIQTWYISYLFSRVFIKNEDLCFIISCVFSLSALVLLFKFGIGSILSKFLLS